MTNWFYVKIVGSIYFFNPTSFERGFFSDQTG